jgi:uncharacterized protein YggE
VRIGVNRDGGLSLTIRDEKTRRRHILAVDEADAKAIAEALFDGKGTRKEMT